MAGLENDVLVAKNLNFDEFAAKPHLGIINAAGKFPIGSGAVSPAAEILAGTLTSPGSTISIGYVSPNITIDVSGSGFTWHDVITPTQLLAVNNGYVTDDAGGVTYTLPATATLGDEIRIVGKSGLATIAQNANQQILIGSTGTTVGITGSIVATSAGDCIDLICITSGASTVWRIVNSMGNLTVN